MKDKNYAALDYFRIIAAILVVAIHTSPLSSCSPVADFLLTRVFARVAVPFFFMVSGFFLFSQTNMEVNRLKSFIKKIACIYGLSILIYLPLNVYTGYFNSDTIFIDIAKDIIFNGTFYHLWYLPAAILGSIIAWFLIKNSGTKKAFLVALLLYVVGLLGDSYFGLINHTFLGDFYKRVFQVFDYTRNGIFYAPVFFILGAIIRKSNLKISFRGKTIYLILFTFLMVSEGLLLRNYKLQNHDSMYIMLIPCMYFLFQLLITPELFSVKIKNLKNLRDISLIIYIIHPWMIVLVRLFAKIFKLETVLLGNSLVHFSIVVFSSLLFGIFITNIKKFKNYKVIQKCYLICKTPLDMLKLKGEEYLKPKEYRNRKRYLEIYENFTLKYPNSNINSLDQRKNINRLSIYGTDIQSYKRDRAWIEINLNNLKHNAIVLKNVMPKNCELMAVVKTNAYGHGAAEIAACLNKNGIETFAVATMKEAISLRKNGIKGDILILGHTALELAPLLPEYNLTQTITSYEYGKSLNEFGYQKKIMTHIKIDTGMHRLGLEAGEADKVLELFSMSNLEISGIFTHLCVSDSQLKDDISFTKLQINRFYELLDKIKSTGLNLPKIHIQSSYGLLNYPELSCDYARIGIALYGIFSTLEDTLNNQWGLRPILEIKARVALAREIKAGESVSYGRLFTAEKDMKIAVITMGYGDGYPRHISLRGGNILLHGKRVPILGRICMDQMVVDISETPNVKAGDIATLIGKDGEEEILAAEVAEKAESITNELLCRLGERLERIYIPEDVQTYSKDFTA